MTRDLAVEDFTVFFREIHGYAPFPWQVRLIRTIAEEGRWRDVLALPTGFGKTAALDIAVFHLALEAHRGSERRAPVRIALVVDRRLIVDDAFARAKKIEEALANPDAGSITARVAGRLRLLAGEGNPPLLARRLRGGIPREDDWARTPSQPTILCSTVDQVGSRLLFRGYGVSDTMKPVHAGLIGADCLILLDEAHLSEPFRQTLKAVQTYKSESWRENKGRIAPWGVSLLTATPGGEPDNCFQLEDEDYANPILNRRWTASKASRLIELSTSKNANTEESDSEGTEPNRAEEKQRIEFLVRETLDGLKALQNQGRHPALAVVVNRVARAQKVFEELRKALNAEDIECILMIGPSRPLGRDELTRRLEPIRTGNERTLPRPLLIVSTQCIEAGVDIDLDGLITEAAPLDALRQRFGRLNRAGREGIEVYAAIVGGAKADAKDPIYGLAIINTWKYLIQYCDQLTSKKTDAKIDFGLQSFAEKMRQYPVPKDVLSPKPDAPVLLPAHIDLLSYTSPIPNADPEVSLYLHGPGFASDSVSVVWRADVDPNWADPEDIYRLLQFAPPRTSEAIELPAWVVKRWLLSTTSGIGILADIPIQDEQDLRWSGGRPRNAFRWTGDLISSTWITPNQIKAGDTLVVPAEYGGIEADHEKEYGWNPNSRKAVKDIGHKAAYLLAGSRFAVRVAPELLEKPYTAEDLAEAIAKTGSEPKDLCNALRELVQSDVAESLDSLNSAKKHRVEAHLDLYGHDEQGRPRGVVFVAPLGIKDRKGIEDAATENDWIGSLPGFSQLLEEHCAEVEQMMAEFVEHAGMPLQQIQDLKIAAYLHDAGKADSRFQCWMAYDDPLGPDPDKVLAKSGRSFPRDAKASCGLPKKWRHEALSVQIAQFTPRFKEANDQELVLWLIGTHHGYGRPFFPHSDSEGAQLPSEMSPVLGIPPELPAGYGPQSLAYDWNGLDWTSLYERLKARYGVWELARMEAILRLADHRASEKAKYQVTSKRGNGDDSGN